MTVHIGTWKY